MKQSIRFTNLRFDFVVIIVAVLFLSACGKMETAKNESSSILQSNGQSTAPLTVTVLPSPLSPTTPPVAPSPKTSPTAPAPVQACTVTNGSGVRQYNSGSYGACVATDCNTGYVLANGACNLQSETCSVTGGTGHKVFANGSYGACIAESCSAGYSLYAGACFASSQACTTPHGTGSKSFNNGEYDRCTAVACDANYTLASGACFENSISCGGANGGTGRQTFNETTGGYGACLLTACDVGFSLSQNACIPTILSCSVPNGSGRKTFGISDYGPCVANQCNTGYSLVGGSCSLGNVINAATAPVVGIQVAATGTAPMAVTVAAAGVPYSAISTVVMSGRSAVTLDIANNTSTDIGMGFIEATGNLYIGSVGPTNGQCNISMTTSSGNFTMSLRPGEHTYFTLSNYNPTTSPGPCRITVTNPSVTGSAKLIEFIVQGDMH